MRIALCILTRNERECLEVVLPKIPEPGPEVGFDYVCAVDGGSTDGTLEVFEDRGVPVYRQKRMGRGNGFQLAWEEIDADAYIFFSPDGNEDVLDLPKFRPLLEAGFDMVIASRMMKGGVNEEDDRLIKYRKWGCQALIWIANMLYRREGPFVTDFNGFLALTRDAARLLKLDAADFTIEYQMTIRAFKNRLKIIEFPTVEGQRISGKTGLLVIPGGLRLLRCLVRELLV